MDNLLISGYKYSFSIWKDEEIKPRPKKRKKALPVEEDSD